MYRKKQSRALPMAVALIAIAACDGDNNLGDNIPPSAPPPAAAGDTVAITSTSGTFNIVTFNRATASTLSTPIPITGLAAGDVIVGADIRPFDGNFYAVTRAADGSGKVYMINTSTGAAGTAIPLLTAMGMGTTPTILNGATFGVDFNPVPDRLRITSNTGQNLRINLTAAAGAANTTVDGNLALNTGGTPGVAEVGYQQSFAAACNTTLFYIDTATDRLLVTSDPNGGVVRAVGSTGLGVDATAVGGFEIFTSASGTDTALALLTVGGTTALYTIDTVAGTASIVTGSTFGTTSFVGLGIAPPATAPTQSRGNLVAVTENNALISFNTGGSPAKLCTQPVAITGLQASENVLDIDVRPANGMVYGVTDQSRVYIINPDTGAATSPLLLTNVTDGSAVVLDPMRTAVGIDFNPVPDRLRIVTDTGQNLRVNVSGMNAMGTMGNTNVDGILSTMPIGTMGRVNDVDVTAVAYTNAFTGTPATRLLDIDVLGDNLLLQNPPNDGTVATTILPLGVNADRAVGFDINGLTNQAFAGLNLSGAAATGFYSIAIPRPGDQGAAPTTAATLLGNIAGGARVRGFAIVNRQSQASQSTILAVTNANQVVTFSAAAPGTFLTGPTAITGLNSMETIVGIDQRPSNNLVYVVTNQSRLLTLNPTTGALTPVGMAGALTAMAGDDNPFTALQGTMTFGVDVNPTPNRLRVVSEALENLRINMDNGAVTTDTNLTRTDMVMGAPVISAVAYSNNFTNASATTLWGIDQATNTLQRFVNANGGTLVTVGTGLVMGTSFTPTASFDIVGGDNTYAAAILQPTGMMTQSQLFLINLGTGVASPQPMAGNTVGPMGTVITAATVLLTQLP